VILLSAWPLKKGNDTGLCRIFSFMKTLVQQIQEIMESAEQDVQVVEVRPVSLAVSDFQQEETDARSIAEEIRAN
jgi:predicted nuclease with RNAse H fold